MSVIQGDAYTVLRTLPGESVQCGVTSPPYYQLRDYGVVGQVGLERTIGEYVDSLVKVFSEFRRVLKKDGTLWLNLGDSYAGSGKGGQRDKYKSDNYQPSYPRHAKTKKAGEDRDSGLKRKNLLGIPWRVALALQADGWYLRSDIIWSKPNPMPESVKDRPTRSHEYVFLLTKSNKYYYDHKAIEEPVAGSTVKRMAQDIDNQKGSMRGDGGRKLMKAVGKNEASGHRRYSGFNERWKHKNLLPDGQKPNSIHVNRVNGGRADENYDTRNKRSVWTVATTAYTGAHFAVFPEKLITPCILAGSRVGDVVCDPFAGSGTTLAVAKKHGREYLGIELNPEYIKLAEDRIAT